MLVFPFFDAFLCIVQWAKIVLYFEMEAFFLFFFNKKRRPKPPFLQL